MAKSEMTKKLEREIWKATNKTGVFGCFEVTIGFNGNERVDFLTYDTKGIWRCYEIKVSKKDFYSKSKKTFIGNYNYYVLPSVELLDQVKKDIPENVGVYVMNNLVMRAKKQPLKADENILKDSMIRSLHREFHKQYLSGDKTIIEWKDWNIKELQKEVDSFKNKYYKLVQYFRYKYGIKWMDVVEKEMKEAEKIGGKWEI